MKHLETWRARGLGIVALLVLLLPTQIAAAEQISTTDGRVLTLREYPLPAGAYPHDAVPDATGRYVWYSGQLSGTVGRLDPSTGELMVHQLPPGSAPHGIIVGPDNGIWLTDGGRNAIVRVDPDTLREDTYPLPGERANLNTATFDHQGVLWFTGQNGYYGRLDLTVGMVEQFEAPRGRGPYGISTAPNGTVYYASLAGSYLGRINPDASVTVIDPPTPNAGVRRVWPDSTGRLWISEFNVGQLGVFDPTTGGWREWKLPGGDAARAYSVFVDPDDKVWLSDTGTETIVRFDPVTETFTTVPHGTPSNIAQMGGLQGQVWGGQRQRDHLFVVHYE